MSDASSNLVNLEYERVIRMAPLPPGEPLVIAVGDLIRRIVRERQEREANIPDIPA